MKTLIAIGAVLAMAGTAQAGTKYYFGCTGDQKVQSNQAQTWSTTPPAASFTTGAGCGSVDPGPYTGSLQGHEVDFFGGGKHTGAIQAVNVELHSLLLTHTRATRTPGMEIQLTVDGEPYLDDTVAVRISPVASSTNLTEAYRFSIARAPEFDEEGNELPPLPLVPGTGEHEIELRFSGGFIDYSNLWVWGASEVPAHFEVDPAALVAPTVNPVV